MNRIVIRSSSEGRVQPSYMNDARDPRISTALTSYRFKLLSRQLPHLSNRAALASWALRPADRTLVRNQPVVHQLQESRRRLGVRDNRVGATFAVGVLPGIRDKVSRDCELTTCNGKSMITVSAG